jgi:hypothetical protein
VGCETLRVSASSVPSRPVPYASNDPPRMHKAPESLQR